MRDNYWSVVAQIAATITLAYVVALTVGIETDAEDRAERSRLTAVRKADRRRRGKRGFDVVWHARQLHREYSGSFARATYGAFVSGGLVVAALFALLYPQSSFAISEATAYLAAFITAILTLSVITLTLNIHTEAAMSRDRHALSQRSSRQHGVVGSRSAPTRLYGSAGRGHRLGRSQR